MNFHFEFSDDKRPDYQMIGGQPKNHNAADTQRGNGQQNTKPHIIFRFKF